MKTRIAVFSLLVMTLAPGGALSQPKPPGEVRMAGRQRQTDFFINVAETGIGAGLKFYYDAFNQDTKLGFGLLVSGVRGKDEFVYIDIYGFPQRSGTEFFTMIVPMNVTLKRRLFRESIESNMRPFIVGEAGPVWGIAFPRNFGFRESISKGKGQISVGGFVGFGIEFGEEEAHEYGFTLGFHYIKFPDALGERAEYAGVDFRISFLF